MALLFEYDKWEKISNKDDLKKMLQDIWKQRVFVDSEVIETEDTNDNRYQPFLKFDDSQVRANNFVGFIQNATVSNSFSAGSVTANSVNAVGGFAGYIYGGTISKCYSSSNTIGTDYVGGFVGSVSESNPVLLNNCYALGNITGR